MSKPPFPSDQVVQLDQYWPYQVTVLADRIARRSTQIVKERGINLSQWRVMAAIAEVPGRTSVELVRVTPTDKGIISRATRALLDQGLVRREASQADGRVSHLFLTEAGWALYGELIPEIRAVVSGPQAVLDEAERGELKTLLHRLIAQMDAAK